MKTIFVFIFGFCVIFANGNVVPSGNTQRISGGSVASINEYPFAAVMLTNGGTGPFIQSCGATILTTTALLSAADCYTTGVGGGQNVGWWQARVGSALANSGGTVHNVQLITRHTGFDQSTLVANIAVLRTTQPVQYGATIAPALIAGAGYALPEQEPVWAIGWGITAEGGQSSAELRRVQIWTVPQHLCIARYSSLPQSVTPAVICAGWLDVGIRAQCQGDEGGPLLHQGIVVGVHSFSQACPSSNYPSLNTRVSTYTSWIVNTAVAAL